MIGAQTMTHKRRPHSDAVEALIAAGDRAAARPAQGPTTNRPSNTWTLGYVDATGLQRNADLGEETVRIRAYAERHELTLTTTYVDHPGDDGLGFRSLLAAIERIPPYRVLVSRKAHLDSPIVVGGMPAGERKPERLARLGVTVEEVFP